MLHEMQSVGTEFDDCEITGMKNNNKNDLYEKLSLGLKENEHLNVKFNEI